MSVTKQVVPSDFSLSLREVHGWFRSSRNNADFIEQSLHCVVGFGIRYPAERGFERTFVSGYRRCDLLAVSKQRSDVNVHAHVLHPSNARPLGLDFALVEVELVSVQINSPSNQP